ncbi:hypothetical protein BDR07DRAFT_1464745 [Suillus spraguei]|nr:hypothetical protein BDR07DRAFT_1464745 [Suillus spraguei]
MAPVAVALSTNSEFVTGLKKSVVSPQPNTLHDVITQAVDCYPLHELSFITSLAHDSIQTKTFSVFNQYVRNLARAMLEWGKHIGSVVVVYLTEHEDNMAAIWACLLAGYLPCFQPPLSAQQAHKEGHVAHIKNLLGSATWLTNEVGAEQINTISGLEVHLLSELKASAEKFIVAADWVAYEAKPDDDAILFLTSGSTGFSKVVVHTHRTILASCRSKGQSFDLTSESRVLNWVGFDHVGGSLQMHITPLLYGASQLHVHASAILTDPIRLLRLIDEKACYNPSISIEIAFAPNFLLSKLTRDLEKRTDLFGCFDLSSIKRINSGGEAIVSKTAQAFAIMMKKLSKNSASFVIAAGFGMTETCAGCIYNPVDVLAIKPPREFLDLGRPIDDCEMRIVDPADGITLRPDGQSGELQVRGLMVFVRYYNDIEATSSSFVEGGWYRTGDIGIIEDGIMRLSGRIKDTLIVHGDRRLHYFILANFRPRWSGCLYQALHHAPGLRDISVKMIALPPQIIIPIPVNQMEKTTLGKLSRWRLLNFFKQGQFAKHIARAEELISLARGVSFVAPSTKTERALAKIYAGIFNLADGEVSASDNFFEIGGTSIDAIRLKREVEEYFGLPDISAIKILKHPVLSSLANYVDSLVFKGTQTEEYDPIVPLQLSGNKTPIFFVHPGNGEVLTFVNLSKYFHNERPFYALRARGFDAGHPYFTSMDEMVSCYTAAVKKTQATGPYAIAGYSYGGIVAFEIAKRLEAMGDEVKFVGLINIPPHIATRMNKIDCTACILNLSSLLGLVSKHDVKDLAPTLRLLTKQEQLEFVWKKSPPGRIVELQLTLEKVDKWVDLSRSLFHCGLDYNPSGSVSALDVFYAIPFAGTKIDWLNNQLKSWSSFSRGEASYTDVPGEHHALMDLEHVLQFQKIFRSRLEARGL